MKNVYSHILLMFALVLCVLCGAYISKAEATYYPDYLWGDPNYMLCYGHDGVASYVDISSLTSQSKDFDDIIFAENVLSVDVEKNEILGTNLMEFRSTNGRTYYKDDGYWNEFDVNDYHGYIQRVVQAYKIGMDRIEPIIVKNRNR